MWRASHRGHWTEHTRAHCNLINGIAPRYLFFTLSSFTTPMARSPPPPTLSLLLSLAQLVLFYTVIKAGAVFINRTDYTRESAWHGMAWYGELSEIRGVIARANGGCSCSLYQSGILPRGNYRRPANGPPPYGRFVQHQHSIYCASTPVNGVNPVGRKIKRELNVTLLRKRLYFCELLICDT